MTATYRPVIRFYQQELPHLTSDVDEDVGLNVSGAHRQSPPAVGLPSAAGSTPVRLTSVAANIISTSFLLVADQLGPNRLHRLACILNSVTVANGELEQDQNMKSRKEQHQQIFRVGSSENQVKNNSEQEEDSEQQLAHLMTQLTPAHSIATLVKLIKVNQNYDIKV
ncbi:unnamed protein product [Protopolystoma xenopodis]|uniref:Uncharacterized protein n=1 Tax=Protopolystoma xenopodis TaxID=117903 RepID=A0A3S5AG29_9PLAT|nr:unnamed protein product [Protopolystoma xenopodis]